MHTKRPFNSTTARSAPLEINLPFSQPEPMNTLHCSPLRIEIWIIGEHQNVDLDETERLAHK